jgi:hypothetical protein
LTLRFTSEALTRLQISMARAAFIEAQPRGLRPRWVKHHSEPLINAAAR